MKLMTTLTIPTTRKTPTAAPPEPAAGVPAQPQPLPQPLPRALSRALLSAALLSAGATLWSPASLAAEVATEARTNADGTGTGTGIGKATAATSTGIGKATATTSTGATTANTTSSATVTEPTPPRAPSPFVAHMQEAHRLIAEQDWPGATDAARQAVLAARPGENSYEEFDAVALLVSLLHKQQRYADARREAEAQIAIFEKRHASDDAIGQLRVMALREGAAAGETAEVARLQQRIFAAANAYPGVWTHDTASRRLHYALADISLPLVTGRWALASFKPSDQRGDSAQLDYVQTLADGSALTARVWIRYREDLRGKDAGALREMINERMREPESDQTLAADIKSALPDLPFQNTVSAKRALRAEYPGGAGVEAEWIALRGDWNMNVRASFRQDKQQDALAQLRILFDAMSWTGDKRLFRDKTMMEQSQEIESYWSMARDWDQAAELAQAALPDAAFPLELARLHTVIGRAAYDDDDLPSAKRSLDLALAAWAHAGKAYQDETLYQIALDLAADIAYRQGRTQDAVALNRLFIEWVDSHADGWTLDAAHPVLMNPKTGMRLPLRIGEFRLEPIDLNRFYYRNLKTGEQLGLSVNQNAEVPDDKLEASMRAFIESNLGLHVLGMQAEPFTPRAQAGMPGELQGRLLRFQVEAKPADSRRIDLGGPSDAPPAQMLFWVVDRGASRSILRAPLPDSGAPTSAEAFARTLEW